jgi:hypothetical protein
MDPDREPHPESALQAFVVTTSHGSTAIAAEGEEAIAVSLVHQYLQSGQAEAALRDVPQASRVRTGEERGDDGETASALLRALR